MSLRVTDDEYLLLQRRTGKVQSDTLSSSSSKKNKYGAVRKEVDGHVFHSTAEAKRYIELKRRESLRVISGLEIQPRFPINVDGHHVCDYVADFAYQTSDGYVVEDVKGFKTEVYRLKKKLVEAIYCITITEISTRR